MIGKYDVCFGILWNDLIRLKFLVSGYRSMCELFIKFENIICFVEVV